MGLCRRPVWRRRSAAVHYFRYGFRHRALHSRRRQWRLAHGVFGYSRWRNEAFLGAIAHWYASRFNSDIDPQSVVYGPSVIYMVAETIRQWSKEATASWSTPLPTMRSITPSPLTGGGLPGAIDPEG